MKTLKDMTDLEQKTYLSILHALLAAAAEARGAYFVLILTDGDGLVHTTSNVGGCAHNAKSVSGMLRAVADRIEERGTVHERN